MSACQQPAGPSPLQGAAWASRTRLSKRHATSPDHTYLRALAVEITSGQLYSRPDATEAARDRIAAAGARQAMLD
jgi:hypothetical protein